jgi:hypothetical protein
VGSEEAAKKSQIAMLDTFHPVLLLNAPDSIFAPGALWIESYHPLGSKFAYDVEFVDPKDTAKDERLDLYRKMYEQLLHGPHVDMLRPTNRKSRSKLGEMEDTTSSRQITTS